MIGHALALALLLTTLPAAAAEGMGQRSDVDKRAVEAAADEADANWNARNVSGMAALHADDATLVVGGGTLTQGQAAVLDYFTHSFLHRCTTPRWWIASSQSHRIWCWPILAWRTTRPSIGALKQVRDFNTFTLLAQRDGRWKPYTVCAYPVASRRHRG